MSLPTFRVLGLSLCAGVLLASCATPPRGRTPADDPAAPSPARESTAPKSDDGYGLEHEGTMPEPPGDVAFEEDALPPRPEDVSGASLDEAPIDAVDVEAEVLPDPDADGRIAPAVTTPVPPAVSSPVVPGTDTQVVRGFRLQLFAVTEYAKANTMAEDARQRLAVPVHVVSEPPYYKVRAGDFVDRADAVRLKERATSMGFEGCWVVTDEVEVRK